MGEVLRQASECECEDGKWLLTLLGNGEPATMDEMNQVFLAQGEDARAMYFVAFMGGMMARPARVLLQRAAELGYAPAQAWVAGQCDANFAWAEKAAAQGDCDGLRWQAWCFWNGNGCEKDEQRALEMYNEAAELGHVEAQVSYGQHAFGENDWQRYLWWGRAAAQGHHYAIRELVLGATEHLRMLNHCLIGAELSLRLGLLAKDTLT